MTSEDRQLCDRLSQAIFDASALSDEVRARTGSAKDGLSDEARNEFTQLAEGLERATAFGKKGLANHFDLTPKPPPPRKKDGPKPIGLG